MRLIGMYLMSMHLMGVYLMGVHLTGVYLIGTYGRASLTGVHLPGELWIISLVNDSCAKLPRTARLALEFAPLIHPGKILVTLRISSFVHSVPLDSSASI
jgi:hypothetical protein